MTHKTDREPSRRRFGAALRARRELQHLNQGELATELDLAQTMVSNYENGAYEPPPETAFKIEKLLKSKPGELTRLLGYIPVSAQSTQAAGVVEAIVSDRHLGRREQEAMIALYQNLASSPPTTRKPRSSSSSKSGSKSL
jgi:transcriptional regulator with XRE-family HTH domain